MLSWNTLLLIVAAAIVMNGVVGLEQGHGGGIPTTAPPTEAPTTAPPTSTESSSDQQSDSQEYGNSQSQSIDASAGSQVEGSSTSDEGSDAYPGETPGPDSSYGNSYSWDGSEINGGSGSYPGGKVTSGDGSIDYIEVPSDSDEGSVGAGSPSSSGSIDGDVGGSVDVPDQYPTSSTSGSDRDTSIDGEDSTAGEASTSGSDDQHSSTGGCKVRTRRLRQ
ncbi:hypothetical protein V7S43_009851 [Phytophthora oleae]|uniref:RxLR effector protein n=1 Tax=Phytophthora oleae TaxID=2107226 RepID=A0ABD3FE46_9STRA